MRNQFTKSLELINLDLINMATLVDSAISNAVKALIQQDVSYCRLVDEFENEINEKEKEIESLCTNILLKQAPVANDFKLVTSAQKIAVNLERIGDNSQDIANIARFLEDKQSIKQFDLIPKMAQESIKMVHLSIDAFVKKDMTISDEVVTHDDIVDDFFIKVKEKISIIIHNNPSTIDVGLELLMAAKYFEKISDHAVNIANHVKNSI